jgi:ferredoxin-NADP reductase
MDWIKAKIVKVSQTASDMKSIVLDTEIKFEFKSGQHFELCIPGTNVIRKYSVVSSMYQDGKALEFGIQLISNGALSTKIWELNEGDELEIRGPLGRSFVWDTSVFGPLVIIGAGSGITPLLSIYDSFRHEYPNTECVFIMSAKDSSRIMKYDQIKDFIHTRFTNTEGRIDVEFLKKHIGVLSENKNTVCYICGPDNFIDDVVDMVSEIGIGDNNIKSERFI